MPTRIGATTSRPGSRACDGDVEADLVVALAGAAVGDRVGAFALGDLDEQLRDQRPRERRGQRVGALVERAGLQVRPHESVTNRSRASTT